MELLLQVARSLSLLGGRTVSDIGALQKSFHLLKGGEMR